MDRNHYLRAKELFLAALEVAPAQRESWLREQGLDAGLLATVRELLQAIPSAEVADQIASPLSADLPEKIGAYRLTRLLGVGGMGLVFEAVQDRPHRKVALKMLRAGSQEPERVYRFQREIETLGRLSHPGIAQVLEGGTVASAAGEMPYFAMELVEGSNLLDFCQQRNQTLPQRLELLLQVCQAVQHAHQQGILHRDLKPDNILVDSDGCAKVLDFGISRSLDPDWRTTWKTEQGQLLGTLPYMSPEQVADTAEAIDARSDVYSLGVLCYELLSGKLPVDLEGLTLPQAVVKIESGNVRPLASIYPEAAGDLHQVVHKALNRDRIDRYATAADLGADLHRVLQHQPVTARPPTALYQLRKFAQRNRALAVSLCVTALAIVAGSILSLLFALRATRDRDRATEAALEVQQESQKLAAVNEFLRTMLGDADPFVLGARGLGVADRKVVDVLDEAADGLEITFRDQPEVEAALRLTLGQTFLNLHALRKSQDQLLRARDLWQAGVETDSVTRWHTRMQIAATRAFLDEPTEAEKELSSLQHEVESALGSTHELSLAIRNARVVAHCHAGQSDAALDAATSTLEACLDSLGAAHPTTLIARHNLAHLFRERGNFEKAGREYATVLEARVQAVGDQHPDTNFARRELAVVRFAERRFGEAEQLFQTALDQDRNLYGPFHAITLSTTHQLAAALIAGGKHQVAEPLIQSALQELDRQGLADSAEVQSMRHQLARILCLQGHGQAALELDRKALEWRRQRMGENHPLTLASLVYTAESSEFCGQLEAAEALYFDAISIAEEILPHQPQRRAAYQLEYGRCLRRLGRTGESEENLLASFEGLAEHHGDRYFGLRPVILELIQLYEDLDEENAVSDWRHRLGQLQSP